jgi:hypothetical protein
MNTDPTLVGQDEAGLTEEECSTADDVSDS